MTPTAPRTAWARFWFAPADPTTLGFMRIVTGLIVLYVHVVYALDFQAFFGRDGWYGLAEIDRERREFPVLITPFAGEEAWQEVVVGAHVPIVPHRRDAVIKFVRDLPADPGERAARLRYLARLQKTNNLASIRDGLLYVRGLTADARARATHLDAMVNKELRQPSDAVPEFVDSLPEDDRKALRGEVEALLTALPRDAERRTYVIDHFLETHYFGRQQFLDFLEKLPADPAERERKVAYLEFWNTDPDKAFRTGLPVFSQWFHVTDPTEQAVLHGCVLVLIVLFTLGVCTRVTSILTWLAVVGYIHRTQQVLFGMDTMMNVLLIYLMVGNSGAALSVDRLVRRYRAARQSLAKSGTIDAATKAYLDAPPKSVSCGFAYRLIQIHFCFMYMAAGLSKLKGAAWWNTSAFWDTMINPEFTLVHFQWYESLLRALVEHRWLYALYAAGGVGFTFIMELGLPFLVWTRMRPYAVMGGIMLHFGIAVFMGLNLFGLLMMTLLLSYIPGNVIRDQLRGTGPPLTLRFNARSARQAKAAATAAALDTDGRLEVLATSSDGVRLTTATGEQAGPAAGKALLGELGVPRKFWPLNRLPGLASRLAPPAEAAPGKTPPAPPQAVGAK